MLWQLSAYFHLTIILVLSVWVSPRLHGLTLESFYSVLFYPILSYPILSYSILFHLSINLLASYNEYFSLIGYSTHYLLCDLFNSILFYSILNRYIILQILKSTARYCSFGTISLGRISTSVIKVTWQCCATLFACNWMFIQYIFQPPWWKLKDPLIANIEWSHTPKVFVYSSTTFS